MQSKVLSPVEAEIFARPSTLEGRSDTASFGSKPLHSEPHGLEKGGKLSGEKMQKLFPVPN